MRDIITTPASGKIDFYQDLGAASLAKIELTATNDLALSSISGNLIIGDASRDIYIGNGINDVDIIFEQNGEIRPLPAKTLNIGTSGSFTQILASKVNINQNSFTSIPLDVYSSTSGATILNVAGTKGALFSVTDNLSGSLMSVNNDAGLPVFEVFSDDRVVAGRFGQNDFIMTSGGNVGIGTGVPSSKFHVLGTSTFNGDVSSTGSFIAGSGSAALPSFEFINDVDTGLFSPAANTFGVSTSGVERLRVDSVGNIGIGTTTPTSTLQVSGLVTANSGNFTNSLTVNSTGVSISGHTHTSSDITNFNSSVSGLVSGIYAPLSSPALIGTPTAPTASSGTNTTQIASTAFVRTEISNLVSAAPATLDTLNELAAALGNDASFSTTVTTSLAGKASLSGATFTGSVSGPSGNFTSLKVNSVDVSAVGHTHTSSNITDFNSSVSGLLPTIANSGDNRVLTSTGGSVGVNAESNLTFNGNLLSVTGSGSFSNNVTASGFVRSGGTSSQFLKADGSIDSTAYTTNAGTVTSVAALTLGTTGTDVTSTVATNTTTPVITLNIPTASASNRGALSSTDWTTFNNKAAANQTMFIGTTSVAINRSSAALVLTGITSIDGNAGTVTNGVYTSRTITPGSGLAGSAALDLSADRTFNVGQGDGITVSADSIAVNSTVVRTTGVQGINGLKGFYDNAEFGAGNQTTVKVGEGLGPGGSGVGVFETVAPLAAQYWLGTEDIIHYAYGGGTLSNPRIAVREDSGNVGIGISTPSAKLHVVGSGIFSSGIIASNISVTGNMISATNSNGNLIIKPNASGALQADDGGNSRGVFSVDLQRSRVSVSGVAHGEYSVIAGGGNNRSAGNYSTVGGGINNSASSYGSTTGGGTNNTAGANYSVVGGGTNNSAASSSSTIGGGSNNSAGGNYSSTVGGGQNNTAGGTYSVVCGGASNSAGGDRSTVGGGFNNTASNTNCTIGGGLSNTASGYKSTIGGGGANNAVGENSTIGGGSNNSAGAYYYHLSSTVGGGQSNSAGGYYATIGGGKNNSADNTWSTVGGGNSNSAGGYRTTVGGGASNSASSESSTVGGGSNNTTAANYSTVPGGRQAKATRYGETSHSAGQFGNKGDAQHTILIARNSTVNASGTVLFLDGSSSRLTIPAETTWIFTTKLSAYNDTDNLRAGYNIRGCIGRNAAPSGTSIIGSNIVESWSEGAMSGCVATATADTTNQALQINVNGLASKNIRWVAVVDISQVSYGTP